MVVAEVTSESEAESGQESVGHHDQKSSCDTNDIVGGQPHENESHVGNTGKTGEHVELFLADSCESDKNQVSGTKQRHDVNPVFAA